MKLFMWGGIPFFLALNFIGIAIEYYFLRRGKHAVNFDFKEAKVTTQIFLVQAFTNGAFRGINGIIIYWVYNHRILNWEANPWLIFPLGLFISEFCYYWTHRFSHRTRIGWLNHLVHHAPKSYNVSMSLRLSLTAFSSLTWAFFLPMAWLGFKPIDILFYYAINQAYQFWLHTELNPRLGWIEKIFVVPTHHRVHHHTARESLDKNYGAIFIVFDHWFGTFKAEDRTQKAVYGILDEIDTHSFWSSTMSGWVSFFKDFRRFPGITNKLKMVYMPADWVPAEIKAQTKPDQKTAQGF